MRNSKNVQNADEDLTKTDETTISSTSSKKNYKSNKRNSTYYSPLNISIINPKSKKSRLSEIKEKEKEEENFCLLTENKNRKEEKFLELENNNYDNDEMDKTIDDIINDAKKNREKSAKKNFKTKKSENYVTITDYFNKENDGYINDVFEEEKNKKGSKNSKKSKNSRANSKNKIDLKFLDEEEKEEFLDDDFKMYVQNATDEEEDYKIIYEFNKLPFKPITKIIDLSVFDTNSILMCISKCYFDKSEQNFVLKLYFTYLSNENNKYNEDTILDFFNQQESLKKPEEKEVEVIPLDSKEITNSEEENYKYEDDDTIGITVRLKKFKISNGTERTTSPRVVKLKKKNFFKKFQELIIEEKEDLQSYINYHQIFYIITIQKNIFIKSKRFFVPDKIGIKNEGNTCYMNSIIQSLYNNPFLLKRIMQINTDSDVLLEKENEKHREVILALQKIFYDLYKEKKAIKILDIFYAFDWRRTFWNSPQDAEEIYIMIYDIISSYDSSIKLNCEGILENTIEVDDINYRSINEENFFFMQLDLEKNTSVEECLKHFFEKEKLNGDNKYQYVNNAGEKKLFDAEKFYKFKKIPNFLFLQLKRFTFDNISFTFDKKNKAIKYSEELDLTEYLDKNNINNYSKNKNKEIYELYCILVHSGSAKNGHYYCIVKDFKDNCYIKFNDTSVFIAEKKEVFNQLFGGEQEQFFIEDIYKNNYKKEAKYEVINIIKEITKNAYILIYVKKDKIKNLFNDDNIKEIFDLYQKKNLVNIEKDNEKKKEKEIRYPPPKSRLNYNIIKKNKNNNYKYNNNGNNAAKRHSNININMNINNPQFGDIFNSLKIESYKYVHKESNNNKIADSNTTKRNKESLQKNKNNNFYSYVGDQKATNYSKKIYNKIQSYDYPSMGLNESKNYFFLIQDISSRIKGNFFIQYNTKIYTRQVTEIIKKHLSEEKNEENSIKILEKITKSKTYKLALVNTFGIFLEFLEDENEDLTPALKYESMPKLKHLCLYDLNYINTNDFKNMDYVVSVNFIPKSLLKMILIKDKNIYDNFKFNSINISCFFINEEFNDQNTLINRLKDLYVNYFGNLAEKNVDFSIYIIKESDIFNLDVLNMKLIPLTYGDNNILLYLQKCSSTTGKKKYCIQRLLVGI